MILIKDSFGNSLVPFLARHYDLIVLDMRVYTGDMEEFLSDPALSHILVAYNMETFMNDENISNAALRIIPYFRSQSNCTFRAPGHRTGRFYGSQNGYTIKSGIPIDCHPGS